MTKKSFIRYSDPEIVQDLIECCLFPEFMPFREFLRLYQARHRAKYGQSLNVFKMRLNAFKENTFAPLVLIPFGAVYFFVLYFI